MRRTWAVAALAAGMMVLAACGGGGSSEDGSTAAVCERVDTEAADAHERFLAAAVAINEAGDDQVALVLAAADAQNAASDLVDVYRSGAAGADDEELAATLTEMADELESAMNNVDPAALDEQQLLALLSGFEAAEDRYATICGSA